VAKFALPRLTTLHFGITPLGSVRSAIRGHRCVWCHIFSCKLP